MSGLLEDAATGVIGDGWIGTFPCANGGVQGLAATPGASSWLPGDAESLALAASAGAGMRHGE